MYTWLLSLLKHVIVVLLKRLCRSTLTAFVMMPIIHMTVTHTVNTCHSKDAHLHIPSHNHTCALSVRPSVCCSVRLFVCCSIFLCQCSMARVHIFLPLNTPIPPCLSFPARPLITTSLDFSNRSDLTGISTATLQDACQISERYKHYNTQSHGFETSWDLTETRPTA